MQKRNFKNYKKFAMLFSLCTLILWAMLGTGASLAWFKDTTPVINNIFHFADFELDVYHRLTDGKWEKVDSQTKIFNEEALYEPGYVEVVYLKVENNGDCAFTFKTAVNVTKCVLATNVFGQQFSLQDYLRFGMLRADTLDEIKTNLANRQMANEIADKKLNNYATGENILPAGETAYVALVVCMPEEVGNVANYRGDTVPKVELGIIVNASQTEE